jgi:formylglycine-generating enzyme required for sulfatase activity
MGGRVYISYRREDAGWPAFCLHDLLAHEFPCEQLVMGMEIDSIPSGLDFVEWLELDVVVCQVMVVMIGPGWLAARDEAGNRRLDDPNDFVRIEIAAALQSNTQLIPVLMDGAVMPREEELPEPLRQLARRQAVRLSREWLSGDAGALVRVLKEVVSSCESFRDMDGGPEMVVVPAGSFLMGSPADEPGRRDSEGPQHKVTIAKPFAIGCYPVTRGQFDAFVRDAGYCLLSYLCGAYDHYDYRNPGFDQDDSHPVVNVYWDDAKAYANWLSGKTGKDYRLPSEAEWEYAARAGTTTPYWWGWNIDSLHANYGGCRAGTVPVTREFQPNSPWGLYQVHGNVWEWVEDCWNDTYAGAPGDGSAWTSGECSHRVFRGGAWDENPALLRSAARSGSRSSCRDNATGFRVARTFTS